MRELNGRGSSVAKKDASGSFEWRSDNKKPVATSQSISDDISKRKATKRSRLPAAAVKEMRWAGVLHLLKISDRNGTPLRPACSISIKFSG